jgi:hypothetical protein
VTSPSGSGGPDIWRQASNPAPALHKPGAGTTESATKGLATVAFVTGLLGMSVIGLVLGAMALRRMDGPGRPGRRRAIAGIVLSVVWIVVSLFIYQALLDSQSCDWPDTC